VADGSSPARWRGIDELAALVGTYCWIERHIFVMTGLWAAASGADDGDTAGAEARVWCAASSRRHGDLAARWAGRLPVRAGVDACALVRAPSGALGDAFAELVAVPEATAGLAPLVEAVLPALDAVYRAHLESASPVSEASVLEVLTGARREVAAEIRGGRALVEALPEGSAQADHLGVQVERAFAETDVFPGVRPS
jgi:hypothetical protein